MSSLKRALHDARLWPVALVVSLSLSLLLAGCGKQPLSGSFAGHVANSQALTALVTSDHNIIAYACDSQTLAAWFSGSLSDRDTLDVTNQGGARLQATLTATQAMGTLTLPDGQAFSFTAPAVSGDAGLYRAKQDLQGQPYVGSWILLPGGEERGLVTQGNTPVSAQPITPGHLTVNVMNVGQLAAHQITPEFVSMNVSL